MHLSTIDKRDARTALDSGTLGGYLRGLAEEPKSPERPALVVQGGGLRGIYSLSALSVLEELGLRDAFSRVVGSSAGAINGAYFLAGQANYGLSIYTDDLSNRDFVNPWRLRKMVDVDYMIEVLKRNHPLDVKAMLAAPATLYTVLTDAETAAARTVSSREPGYDVYEVFRATAALPGLYNKRIELPDGRSYVDGGLAGLVPLDQALAGDPLARPAMDIVPGPAEVLVLLTRGHGHRRFARNALSRLAIKVVLAWKQSASVRAKVCAEDHTYNAVMTKLEKEAKQAPRQTWTLWPSDLDRLVSRTTNDRDKLLECAALGREDMLALLAEEHDA